MSHIIKNPGTGREFVVDTSFVAENRFHSGRRSVPANRKHIVVHHTAGNTPGDLAVLRGATGRRVSVKYLVPDTQDGSYLDPHGRLRIFQLLPDDVIGWSIGNSTGALAHVTNATSDSIEVSNLGTGADEFENLQVEAVEALIAFEEARLDQELNVYAHFETSPGRKVDPYKTFPLQRIKAFAAAIVRGHILTPAPKPATKMPTLRIRSTGWAVKVLQTALNARGAYPRLKVDGDFGPKTLSAVIAYQRRARIGVDGVVGPQTWGSLGY